MLFDEILRFTLPITKFVLKISNMRQIELLQIQKYLGNFCFTNFLFMNYSQVLEFIIEHSFSLYEVVVY